MSDELGGPRKPGPGGGGLAHEGLQIDVEPLDRDILEGVPDGDERRIVDLAVLPWFEDERPLRGLAGLLDWRGNGMLSKLIREGWCTGSAGESVLVAGRRGMPCARMVLFGLGGQPAFTHDVAVRSMRSLVDVVRRLHPRDVAFSMPAGLDERDAIEEIFAAFVSACGTESEATPAAEPQAIAAAEPQASAELEPPVIAELDPEALAELEPEALAEPVAISSADPDADASLSPYEPRGAAGQPDHVTADDPMPSHPDAPVRPRWWVLVDGRHVARLRRLLEGPLRAARS